MSFLTTRCPVGCVTASMLRSAAMTNYSGLRVFLGFYCHTIALMSKVLQQHSMKLFSQIGTRFPSCVKLSSKLLQWQSAHLAIISAVRVFERAVRAHAYISRRAAVTMGRRGNFIE
jgi:hypothetical protein